MAEEKLTHIDEAGNARMVDVSGKAVTRRVAVASGQILVSPEVMAAIQTGGVPKGDVLAVARVAGIMAAKKTPELIPLCHSLSMTSCTVDFTLDAERCAVEATCTAATTGVTGVEMEAITGVSVALCTVYDMCKAIDKGMTITGVHLVRKEGGKSGLYVGGGPRA